MLGTLGVLLLSLPATAADEARLLREPAVRRRRSPSSTPTTSGSSAATAARRAD